MGITGEKRNNFSVLFKITLLISLSFSTLSEWLWLPMASMETDLKLNKTGQLFSILFQCCQRLTINKSKLVFLSVEII